MRLLTLIIYNNRQLEVSSQTEDSQENLVLQRVVPLVERKLANIEEQNRLCYEQLSDLIKQLVLQVSDISTGRAPIQINIDWPQGSDVPHTVVRNISNDQDTTPPLASSQQVINEVSSTSNQTSLVSSRTSFRLSTHVQTVTDLYREWTDGLGGNHSVEYMNANNPGWYKDQKSFYMRRRKILKTCEEYAESNGVSVLDAVRRAEESRVRNKKSLDYLSKNPATIFTLL